MIINFPQHTLDWTSAIKMQSFFFFLLSFFSPFNGFSSFYFSFLVILIIMWYQVSITIIQILSCWVPIIKYGTVKDLTPNSHSHASDQHPFDSQLDIQNPHFNSNNLTIPKNKHKNRGWPGHSVSWHSKDLHDLSPSVSKRPKHKPRL